jgi:quercetin dioxygenase-like cupin family protein
MVMVPREDAHGPAEAYALDALEADEKAAFESHLEECGSCARDVYAHRRLLHDALSGEPAAPSPELRAHVMEFADAPRTPVDFGAYTWEEPLPGVFMTTLFDDPDRGVRKVLVWGKPGARYPLHRHLGDEEILVLEGALGDARAVYRAGDICRSREGSVHAEHVVGDEDCVCFVVYHGGHERIPEE